MTNDDLLVALHEGSHAVVGATSGLDVRFLVLHRGSHRGERGAERGRIELFDATAERDADMPRYIRFLLAGAAAEHRHTGRYSERDADDVECARTLIFAALECEPDDPRVKAHFDSAQAVVNAWMRDDVIWGWIERVARALVTKRRLSGRDVAELREARR